ncbi:MAG: elongation factor P [Minisyncoccales bacterium]
MLEYNELKPGTYIILEGKPYVVLEYNFLRMQQRKPAVQTKIKDLISGKVISRTFHSNERVEEAVISKKKVKFLYSHRGEFWFHPENNPRERFKLSQEIIGEAADFLTPNLIVDAIVFSAEKEKEMVINIALPPKVDLKVIEAPSSFKGDTASGGSKQVKLQTGAIVNVPFFINQGDIVRINTQTGEYVERVQKA